VYRKLHLFDREPELFDPGDRPPAVQEWRGLRIGMMICFDWLFPETARLLALAGADLIAHPSNLILDHCQAAMRTRALENGVFAATVNRVGGESRPDGDNLVFSGRSQLVDPLGETLCAADESSTSVQLAAIDPERARDKRITRGNDRLGDRRAEHYGALTRGAVDGE
jgi:predicted amidohydrolase